MKSTPFARLQAAASYTFWMTFTVLALAAIILWRLICWPFRQIWGAAYVNAN